MTARNKGLETSLLFHNDDRNVSSNIVLELPHGPGNPRNSEGSFAAMAEGRIPFACTRFHAGDGDDHAPAAIAGRFSAAAGRYIADKTNTGEKQ